MKTVELAKHKVTDKGQYELVNGTFEPDDCLEILTHLLQEKINFHSMRSFSQLIQTGKDNEASLKRIEELKDTRAEIKGLIEMARRQGKTLSIQSNISIDLV